jgi:hypothetical protein
MNDGQQPKRNIFTYILPYILMAVTVGLFVWLILSQTMGTTNVGARATSIIILELMNHDSTSWVAKVDADGNHTLASRTRRFLKAIKPLPFPELISIRTIRKSSYSVVIEENKWNADFEATYTDSIVSKSSPLPTPLILMSSIKSSPITSQSRCTRHFSQPILRQGHRCLPGQLVGHLGPDDHHDRRRHDLRHYLLRSSEWFR